MTYYALGNVVYSSDHKAVFVVAPVWGLKFVANASATLIADNLNDLESDGRDVLRGSLD